MFTDKKALIMNVVRVKSFVRGYHVYLDIWEAKIGDEHRLKREPNNTEDKNAVAVVRKWPKSNSSELSDQVQPVNSFIHPNTISDDNEVIAHIPKLMALWVTKFLKRATNSGTVVITGKRINRGAGYGVELPCQYTFQGDEFSCKWLKDKLKNEHFDVEN